jgi:hypothetical protein
MTSISASIAERSLLTPPQTATVGSPIGWQSTKPFEVFDKDARASIGRITPERYHGGACEEPRRRGHAIGKQSPSFFLQGAISRRRECATGHRASVAEFLLAARWWSSP